MKFLATLLLITCSILLIHAQPVSGVWKGKVTRGNGLGRQSYKLELKLIKKGDSLVGTSYYFASSANYYRYSVKGYFDATDNSVNWWDDQLIESKSGGLKLGSFNTLPMMAEADFNCPGSGIMKLDGNAHPKMGGNNFELHMDKDAVPTFKDEWDPVLENYFYGGADPDLIDSVSRIAFNRTPIIIVAPPKTEPAKPIVIPPAKPEIVIAKPPTEKPKPIAPVVIKEIKKEPEPVIVKTIEKKPEPVIAKPIEKTPEPVIVKAPPPPTVEEKFAKRKNVLTTEIPILADSIEFRFYDNAEVDGDSITVFLNNRMVETHVRLSEKPYVIKIATADLQTENELVMVAENLGSIPPNTAYMEAWSGGIRYTARMESTELSSAMIKLVRR
ncbi:MAG: hypothetical protein V4722_10240 [Bacteroidota bacterium]